MLSKFGTDVMLGYKVGVTNLSQLARDFPGLSTENPEFWDTPRSQANQGESQPVFEQWLEGVRNHQAAHREALTHERAECVWGATSGSGLPEQVLIKKNR